MKISVSAPSGLEGVTKRELYNLLKVDAPANNGSLTFNGDIVSVAKCNLFLRTASRVYIVLGSFKAPDFDSLFDAICNWLDYFLHCQSGSMLVGQETENSKEVWFGNYDCGCNCCSCRSLVFVWQYDCQGNGWLGSQPTGNV